MSDDRLARLMRGDEKGSQGVGDRMIRCVDCGRDFDFGDKDQEFYRERGFSPPKRCKECRQAKKGQRGGQR